MTCFVPIACALLCIHLAAPIASGQGIRARDLGTPFEGVPGPLNAITDVPGVEVGHVTLIRGNGPLVKGDGPVRTGVTAILPRGRRFDGIKVLPNAAMNALFAATVEATEEAILNAMVAARTMTGRDSLTVHALPHDRLQSALKKYNRFVDPASLPRPAVMTPEAMERLVGTYWLVEPGVERRIYVERGMLFLERSGGGRNRLLPVGDRRFVLLGAGGVFEEVPAEAGRPLRFRWLVGGEPNVTLERVASTLR